MPPQCSTGSTIQDIYTWLKAEPELAVRSTKHDNIALIYPLNILSFIYSLIIQVLLAIVIKFSMYI